MSVCLPCATFDMYVVRFLCLFAIAVSRLPLMLRLPIDIEDSHVQLYNSILFVRCFQAVLDRFQFPVQCSAVHFMHNGYVKLVYTGSPDFLPPGPSSPGGEHKKV